MRQSNLTCKGCSCSTVKQPLGWTLPSFSWYIDQTIAGAVSTATHGSTLKYGSMSNMVSVPAQSSGLAPMAVSAFGMEMSQPFLGSGQQAKRSAWAARICVTSKHSCMTVKAGAVRLRMQHKGPG